MRGESDLAELGARASEAVAEFAKRCFY